MPEISDTDHQKRGDKPSLYEGLVLNTIRRHQPVTAGNLYQLVNAFENQYRNQLRRHHQSTELPQPDLFEAFDDELPTF